MIKTTDYEMYITIKDKESEVFVDVEYEIIPEQFATFDQEPIPKHVEIHSIMYGNKDITDFFDDVQLDAIKADILK